MTKKATRWRAAPLAALAACLSTGGAALALDSAAAPTPGSDAHPLNVQYKDLKWQKLQPELGGRSSEIAMVHTDPVTKATQLMIRVPKDAHVPLHWHSANETHTVITGTFIMECEGKREVLDQGSFNYTPAKMAHQAWTPPDEGALLFITVDAAWDINWVNGNPKPADVLGGRWN
jgi:quercetin dioxygenase-like cupin family protein